MVPAAASACTGASPDPILTASLYNAGALDAVIHHVVAPFRHCLAVEEGSWLWGMRYSCGGEHLKIRVHGPETDRSRLADLLEQKARDYLSWVEPAAGASRVSRRDVPPIDVEDQAVEDFPDLSFHWTTYRRSTVSLGGNPFLLDDQYVASLTRCLGYGCDMVLAALQPDAEGRFPHQPRQAALLKALLAGLTEIPADRRSAFLAYHRDWLLRVSLIKSGAAWEQGRALLARLDLRAESSGEALAILRQSAAAQWEGPTLAEDPLTAGWRGSLSRLARYVEAFGEDPNYNLDPFAPEPSFPVLFKAFHGLANQLGLDRLNEAYAHHLLLHAIGAVTSGEGVPLIPELAA
ncbi:MAG TPA: lantibiotic dehydratase C-terminal domain-containing protein [Thermoanaerobaculia bacterium]|jgi:hypothetical protein|nr:lantibiotic dehydratase C-terminal domain-containing protein [Thermoanaerobaculia bacterium]